MVNKMSNPNASLVETMKTFSFGVELETVGASRESIAAAIASVTGGTVQPASWNGRLTVALPDGRKWRIEHDGSLAGHVHTAEVVSPILTWTDMEMLQVVTRAIRTIARATTNETCGLHVHVGVSALDGSALGRLAKLCTQQEALLYKALQVSESRVRWCKPADDAFIARVVAQRPATKEALLSAWYGSAVERDMARGTHRHQSRYRGLNLHAVQFHGTAEFRYFDGTLHAGKVKTYVQLCLALVAKAFTSKAAIARKRTFDASTAKYDVRVFLLRIGMIGDVFETARGHLLDHLAGSSSRSGKGAPKPRRVAVVEAVDAVEVAS
jgi:hypothetical protein